MRGLSVVVLFFPAGAPVEPAGGRGLPAAKDGRVSASGLPVPRYVSPQIRTMWNVRAGPDQGTTNGGGGVYNPLRSSG